MLFNSIYFLLFFAALILTYYIVPDRFRWGILLIAGLYFYMCWTPVHIIILLAVTVISYLAGLAINKDNQLHKKLIVTLGTILCFAFLAVYKYFDFFMSSVYSLLDSLNISYSVVNHTFALPVGISFFTFKAVSYIVDVYRGKIVEKNFFKYLLYVSFFPQVASGPIERSTNLIPQFSNEHKFNRKMTETGLCFMLMGYFKKMVVADNIAVIVSSVFDSASNYSPIILIGAACLYSFQIFCDFSGYSDIAIGCASVFGYDTKKNFDHPYFSTSIVDFWRRWHISLSTWFRDYLYIPLGGNRKGKLRKYINLMIVFLVSGLWHGSSWSFVFWGFLHGIYQIIGGVTLDIRKKFHKLIHLDKHEKIHNAISVVVTFSLVTFAWIFFKCPTITEAFDYIKYMFTNPSGTELIADQLKSIFFEQSTTITTLLTFIPFVIFAIFDYKKDFEKSMSGTKWWFKALFYGCAIAYIVMFASTGIGEFIYTRF